MMDSIAVGDMVFLGLGGEGVGAVRRVSATGLKIYIENSGEFDLPAEAVTAVHDHKVVLDSQLLPPKLLQAVRHAHDREDPSVAG